jgi:hypothetical protein
MTGKSGHGKAELRLDFESAMAKQMGINRAIDHGKTELGRQQVFHLFPDECSVDGFTFHGFSPVVGVEKTDV